MKINLHEEAESSDVARWAASNRILTGHGWSGQDAAAIENLMLKNPSFRRRLLLLYLAAKQHGKPVGQPLPGKSPR
jgi:hypothetical protein